MHYRFITRKQLSIFKMVFQPHITIINSYGYGQFKFRDLGIID